MDDELWIVYPISLGTIALAIFMLLMGASVGIQALFEKITQYMIPISIVIGIISLILAIIPTIVAKNPLILLGGVVSTSQLVFYLINSSQAVYNSSLNVEPGILNFFPLVFFALFVIIWFVYTVINLIATLGVLGSIFFYTVIKKENHKLMGLYSGGVGAIGWIINLIIFVVL